MTPFFNKLQRGLKVCFATLCMLLLASPATVHAYDFKDRDFGYNVISYDDLTCEVVALLNSECPKDITIKNTVYFGNLIFRVTAIGSHVFEERHLESIHLPTDITSIGDYAFSHCSFESIELPTGITSIGAGAFSGCSSLKSIKLPTGITSISDKTFSGCGHLKSIELPSGITSIGAGAFSGCSFVKSIELPASITSLGADAFSGCSSLNDIVLPIGLTSIGDRAFYGCSNLKSIKLPIGLMSIGEEAFFDCTSMWRVEFPTGLTSIGDRAFYGCIYLRSIELHTGLTYIGGNAFFNCYALSELILPETLKRVGYDILNGISKYDGHLTIGTPNLKKLMCRSSVPATLAAQSFIAYDYRNTTLFVPKGSLEAYKAADGWKEFYSIVEYDLEDGIDEVVAPGVERKEVGRYDLSGREVDGSHRGITIVRYDDGTTEKVLVK